MKNDKEKFAEIMSSDKFGLLAKQPKRETEQRKSALEQDFEPIINFYNRNGRVPSKEGNLLEKKLAFRLEALRKTPKASIKLQSMDTLGLLTNHKDNVLGIDDPMGLLEVDEDIRSITTLKHVENTGRIDPDYIARRTQCPDYESKYRHAFETISEEIGAGRRHVLEFRPADLESGRYFILQGMLVYLDRDDSVNQAFTFDSGNKTRRDGRTHCIFNNGTQSTLLYRSLVKALEKDGYTVSELLYRPEEHTTINPNDTQKGYIYVLKSRSKNPQIQKIPDLYKIGYCSGEVSNRIRNASNQPTYLMSEVIVVEQARCYNMDVRGFEDTIHKVFGAANVSITIKDSEGNAHHPKEWFSVPINIINQAINLIAMGKAENIRYDPELKILVHVR